MRLAATVVSVLLVAHGQETKRPSKIEVNFKNDANVSFTLMWIPPTQTINEAINVGELPALGKTVQNTFVGHRFQLVPQAAVAARFDAQNGFLTGGGDLHVAEMTLEEAKTRCKGQSSCQGFTYKGDRNLKGKAQIFLKDHFHVRHAAEGRPVEGWTAYQKVVQGAAKGAGAMPRAVDIVCKGSGQVQVSLNGGDISVSGNAVTRKLFRPLVKLAPAPPVAPLSKNATQGKAVPAPEADAEVEGEATAMRPPENEGARLFYQHRAVKVDMISRVQQPVHLFWLDTRAPLRRPMPPLRPGHVEQQSTFIGHRFEVHIKDLKPKIITIRDEGVAYVGHDGHEVVVEGAPVDDKPARYRGPKWVNITSALKTQCEVAFQEFPTDKDYYCSPKFDYRPLTMAQFDAEDGDARIARAKQRRLEQVQATRSSFPTITEKGFRVAKMPPVAIERLSTLLNASRHEAKPEELNWDGLSTDDTWRIPIDDSVALKVQMAIKDAMSTWSGINYDLLRMGNVDGFQIFHYGSRIHRHVEPSRGFSAIVEVARNDPNDTADWPLTLTDHNGEEHTISSAVGNLILYESATVSVAREQPFAGRQFAVLYVHFTPYAWPEAYHKLDKRSQAVRSGSPASQRLPSPIRPATSLSPVPPREASATCSDYSPGECGGGAVLLGGALCTGPKCRRAEDERACCKARASCASFDAAACGSGALASDAAQRSCRHATCTRSADEALCCEVEDARRTASADAGWEDFKDEGDPEVATKKSGHEEL